ncbi:TPA: 2-hydroxymuconate tautomerase family protein [Candidatus Woesearchaeota archaeon]|nr:2-hydroxymuconate tautomerase family protein [Candidatus Woesearchaeota archaeon]HIH41125.1 2-hydroxymuconate tautomerase family protein [Candidatus Woesearchaeota archaeon]
MPIVRIDLWAGRTPEIKEKLIQNVSKAVAETIGKPVDHVTVIINDVPKENWGAKGIQASKL